MHEELLTAVSYLVHRHVLTTLHTMTGELLAKLDGKEAVVLTAPSRPLSATPRPSSLARKKGRRSRASQIATTKASDELAAAAIEASGWPALRQELRRRIDGIEANYSAIAPMLECKTATLASWLSRNSPAPSKRSQSRIRRWLREDATAPAATEAPLYTLTTAEQATLAGHLSLDGNGRELRDRFGANRELLEQAAAGEHLANQVIVRVRAALAPQGSGAAAG